MCNRIRTIYPVDLITGYVQSFAWAPKFNMKYLKKAEGHISRNVSQDEDNSPNILIDSLKVFITSTWR